MDQQWTWIPSSNLGLSNRNPQKGQHVVHGLLPSCHYFPTVLLLLQQLGSSSPHSLLRLLLPVPMPKTGAAPEMWARAAWSVYPATGPECSMLHTCEKRRGWAAQPAHQRLCCKCTYTVGRWGGECHTCGGGTVYQSLCAAGGGAVGGESGCTWSWN